MNLHFFAAVFSAASFQACAAGETNQTTQPPLVKTTTNTFQTPSMPIAPSNPTVKAAVNALSTHDQKAWEALFAPGASFNDDGNEGSLAHFTSNAFGKGKEHFTRVDKEENNGLHIYGQYHSDTWGDFKTFFKFTVEEGKITRLEVGQANY